MVKERLQAALVSTYSIERELGGGGMSRVFVATELALDRPVVLKVLPPDLAQAVSIERFRQEIRLASPISARSPSLGRAARCSTWPAGRNGASTR